MYINNIVHKYLYSIYNNINIDKSVEWSTKDVIQETMNMYSVLFVGSTTSYQWFIMVSQSSLYIYGPPHGPGA